jgi:hypothetical protein
MQPDNTKDNHNKVNPKRIMLFLCSNRWARVNRRFKSSAVRIQTLNAGS